MRGAHGGHRDEGSALVLALVLISFIGLMLTVVIDFAGTGMRATSTHNDIRKVSYAVDGAVEAAIQDIRGRSSAGVDGMPCPLYDPPMSSEGVDVVVECEPLPGSGGSFDDQPPFALLMTGTADGEGINSGSSGGAILTVDGSIYTRGRIQLPSNESNDRLTVYGDITAFGACDPKEKINTIGGTPDCGRGADADDGRWNLDHQPAATSAPSPADPSPVCGANAVEWSPGTYTEVPKQPSTCASQTWWFKPGVYYFDFPAGDDLWSLDKATIIGGTPTGTWSSPGGCKTDVQDPTTGVETTFPGVQLIFGGTSRMESSSQGSLELCATHTSATNRQKIALYGLATGTPPASETETLRDDAADMPPTGHAPASGVTETDDGDVGERVFLVSDTTTTDYDFPDIPEGAQVTKATLRVRHRETTYDPTQPTAPAPPVADKNNLKVDVNVPVLGTTTLTNCADLCTEEIPLLPALGERYEYRQLNDLAVSLTATATLEAPDAPVKSYVDGVEIDVEYVPIGFEKLCETCTLLKSTVNQNLFLNGTVYAPTGGFDLNVNSWDKAIFGRGLIGRTLDVEVSDSSKQADSPFQLPLANPAPRRVLFTGYEVVGAVKTVRLRAVVEYTDNRVVNGRPLAFPGYRAEVESWSVVRPD